VRPQSLRSEYVEFVPQTLEDGVLYISKKFGRREASLLPLRHRGTKIVTSLRETEIQAERTRRLGLAPSFDRQLEPFFSIALLNKRQTG
jgi:hypothetical protein